MVMPSYKRKLGNVILIQETVHPGLELTLSGNFQWRSAKKESEGETKNLRIRHVLGGECQGFFLAGSLVSSKVDPLPHLPMALGEQGITSIL